MSGVGQSSLLEELARRGHFAVDTDYDGWELPGALWDEPRMSEFLASHGDVVVSGTDENQGRFYDQFEHVVLLSVPVEVLIERVVTRTNNLYGRCTDQQAEIRQYVVEVEAPLRRGASIEVDGRYSVSELADALEVLT